MVRWYIACYKYHRKILKEKAVDLIFLKGGGGGMWSGTTSIHKSTMLYAARSFNLPILFFELGALPNTTQLDPCGVNANNSVPRDPEFYFSLPSKYETAPERQALVKRNAKEVEGGVEIKGGIYLFLYRYLMILK